MTSAKDSSRWLSPGRITLLVLAALIAAYAISDHGFLGGGAGFGGTQKLLMLIAVVLALATVLKRQWAAAVLTMFISVAITLAVAEFAARALFSGRYYPPFKFHETRLFELVPGAPGEFRHTPANKNAIVTYAINDDGFRGAPLVTGKPPLRVMVYGDSFIESVFTPLPETFTERLEHYIDSGGVKGVEVINAGVAAYGPDQIISKLTEELPEYKPDLVVVSIFAGNDYGDLIRNKLYRLDDNHGLVEHAFHMNPTLKSNLKLNRTESIIKRIIRDFGKRFKTPEGWQPTEQTPEELVEHFLATNQREFANYIDDNDPEVREIFKDLYNADISLLPRSESTRYKAMLMDAVVKRIDSVAQAYQTPIAFMFIPHPMDVIGEHTTGRVDRTKYPDYSPENPTDLLAGIARSINVPSINLYRDFAKLNPASLYLEGLDDHWNAKGQDLAAKIVAERLKRAGLLKARQQD